VNPIEFWNGSALGEGGFANLSGRADKHHFPFKIVKHGAKKVPRLFE
jgi:hypothetical protein